MIEVPLYLDVFLAGVCGDPFRVFLFFGTTVRGSGVAVVSPSEDKIYIEL